jgi:hemerythrin-like domain-containing protein
MSLQRDPRLQGLSSDHQHALVLALRAERVARGKSTETPEDLWRAIVRAFAEEHEPHFATEERYLLPALAAVGESSLVDRTVRDHAALRELVADTSREVADRLLAFADLLEAHVRFEEREMFEVAQSRLAADVLDAIGVARPKSGSTRNPWT